MSDNFAAAGASRLVSDAEIFGGNLATSPPGW